MTFLPKETINDANSLESILKEMHEAYIKEKVPMDDEQTRFSISIMTASERRIEIMYNDFCKHWQLLGFFKRCNIFKIKYEKRLLVWLGVMTVDFGIGGMILVGYYVQYWASKVYNNGIFNAAWEDSPLTLEEVTIDCFPGGVFAKSTVHEFWDKQKVKSTPDNLIDYPTAALSFTTCNPMDTITHNHESFK